VATYSSPLKMKARNSSETLVNIQQTTQREIQKTVIFIGITVRTSNFITNLLKTESGCSSETLHEDSNLNSGRRENLKFDYISPED
jgi:hypothetical protein